MKQEKLYEFLENARIKNLELLITFDDEDQFKVSDLDFYNNEIIVKFKDCLGVSVKYKKALLLDMSWKYNEFGKGIPGGWWESSDIEKYPGFSWESSEKHVPHGFNYLVDEVTAIYDTVKNYTIYDKHI